MSIRYREAGRARLEEAYRATTYRIFAPAGLVDLHIGESSPALAALLQDAGVDCWAIITAWNPRSRLQADKVNAVAQSRLRDDLENAGYRALRGENIAYAGDWVPEPTYLVLGMPELMAKAWGNRLRQNAVVVGNADCPVRLIWCHDA